MDSIQWKLFPSAAPGAPLVVLTGFEGDGERTLDACRTLKVPDFTLAEVCGFAWDDDLTPWPCPPIRKGSRAFGGKADAFLERLTREILPQIRAALPAEPAYTALAGYSLAGLFALYAAWRSEAFAAAVSASGSLWYPDFTAFLRDHPPQPALRTVYLSLGDAEPRTRHPLMGAVGRDTEETAAILRDRGLRTTFEWNEGNHFRDEDLRTAKGIRWVLENGV